jgi:uncharacterized damage-inducible protein DinB
MIEVATIRELYAYNRWANARNFEAVRPLTPEQFGRDLGSSYPSVRDTLAHIVWAEWLWLQRWKGTSPNIVFEPADFPRAEALEARWLEIEADQRVFLDGLTSQRLASIVRYVNLQSQPWEYPLWRQMYHLVNHSSYHRGQVTAMLRQLGCRAVSTDFLVFQDAVGSD